MAAAAPYWPRTMRQSKAAAYVDCTVPKFARMVADGMMPPPFDLDGAAAWDIVELNASVDALKAGARHGGGRWQDRAPVRA